MQRSCEGSGADLSEVRFEFRKSLFDRVQIRRVWRQVKEPAAVFAQSLRGLLVPMRGEVIEDYDCAGRDLGDQHFADVGGKGGAVHRALDDPRCNQRILGQARDQRLRPPASEGCIHCQALASLGPAPQAGQVRLHCSFINKDNAIRPGGYCRKSMFEPVGSPLPYLGSATLSGNQRLFLYVKPSRDSKLAMEE